MKQISGKEFCKLLEKRGWRSVRIHGSHHIYMKEGTIIRISVPVHRNKTLKIGLLKYFMKVAGLDEEDL